MTDFGEEVVVGLRVGLSRRRQIRSVSFFSVSVCGYHGQNRSTDKVRSELSCEMRADGFSVLVQVLRPDPVHIIRRIPLDVPISNNLKPFDQYELHGVER